MKNIFIGIVVIWILFTMAICGMVKSKYVEERRAQYEIACSKLKKLMIFSVVILLLSSLTIVLWVPSFVAVSYTHLDVYKRQPWRFIILKLYTKANK